VVGLTSYLGVLGTAWNQPNGMLSSFQSQGLTDVHDGTSHTLMVANATQSDFWFGWWYAA